eukprot:TRINITY_DN8093_c0_g1_i1.p1 TRINITY_DN8093_c0_g1~~TRINITY_DN8093_c0_g1_i1.p1  ORF type:complete len:174 (+),score=28.98 TRINITY_DN8093_c0_g1_i1:71-592(+)
MWCRLLKASSPFSSISSSTITSQCTKFLSTTNFRAIQRISQRSFSDQPLNSTHDNQKTIVLTFTDSKKEFVKEVQAEIGKSILEIAHANNIDLEGACEGSLACSTCHVILPKEFYDKLPEPTDEENDMLDLAFGLSETSRLGCQIILNEEMEGMKVTLPSGTRNIQVESLQTK